MKPDDSSPTVIITKKNCPRCKKAKEKFRDAQIYELWQGMDNDFRVQLLATSTMAGAKPDEFPIVFQKRRDGSETWDDAKWQYIDEWDDKPVKKCEHC